MKHESTEHRRHVRNASAEDSPAPGCPNGPRDLKTADAKPCQILIRLLFLPPARQFKTKDVTACATMAHSLPDERSQMAQSSRNFVDAF
jgi:hypothetical protein